MESESPPDDSHAGEYTDFLVYKYVRIYYGVAAKLMLHAFFCFCFVFLRNSQR